MLRKWSLFRVLLFVLTAYFWAMQAQAATPAAALCPTSLALNGQLDPQRQQIVHALSFPGKQTPSQLLHQYIEHTQHSLHSHDFVLRNHVKVALAAQQLNNQAYEEARRILSEVELDSSAAVRAILLLAESYRLQGLHQQAGQWFLRIAERYSSNPVALSALLFAAEDSARSGDIGTALAVYSRVLEKSLIKLKEVNLLNHRDSNLYTILLDGRIDNTQNVASEIILRVLNDTQSDALHHYRTLKAGENELDCLLAEQEILRQTSLEKSLGNSRQSAFIVMLENEKKFAQSDIQRLQSTLTNLPEGSNKRPPLLQELENVNRALSTTEKRLAELSAQVNVVTERYQKELAQIQQRINTLQSQRSTSQRLITQALAQVLKQIRTDYQDLAGDAQLGRAEMQQQAALATR